MLRSLFKSLWVALRGSSRDSDDLYAGALRDAQAGNYAPAARSLQVLLGGNPRHADAWNALGNVNKLQRRWPEAIACYEKAIAVEPRLYSALSNLGICLRNQGRAGEGVGYLERALALAPGNADILFNHALGLIDAGRAAEGEERLARVLELEPRMAEAHFALGCQLLAAGRFVEGWREYEWRTAAEDWERRNAEAPLPWWKGEPLADRTLLVRAEQGLGDQIMFASCLPEVLARDARCIVECDPRLEAIFRRSFPGANVCAATPGREPQWRGAARQPDLQVNLGSLPGLLKREGASFPRHAGYLRPDPAKVDAWRGRLAQLPAGPRIGLSWRGGTLNTRQLARSLPLTALAPLLRGGQGHFVSLQYGDCNAELQDLKRHHAIELHHWQSAVEDYEETAALIAALDRVISVQTAVVHLAGALGRPVWVMVPARAEWRYMRAGATMPWYPSATLLRQDVPGDWHAVIGRIAAELGQGYRG